MTMLFILAQAGKSDGTPTPYLDVSSMMGRIIGLCVLAIIVVVIVGKLKGSKSK